MTEDSPETGDKKAQPETTADPRPRADSADENGDTTSQHDPDQAAGGDGANDDSDPEPTIAKNAGEEEEEDDSDEDEEEDEEDGDEEEPKLKYARLTQHLGAVYRNGDATSSFLVAGDKMVRVS